MTVKKVLEIAGDIEAGWAQTRHVRLWDGDWNIRTQDGLGIRIEWGEQDVDGFYEPTFTIDYADDLKAQERKRIEGVLDAAFEEANDPKNPDSNVGLYAEALMIYRRLVMEAG